MLNVIVTGKLATYVKGFPSQHKLGCVLEVRFSDEMYTSWVGIPGHSVLYVRSVDRAYEVIIKLARQCGELWSGPSIRTLQRRRREYASANPEGATFPRE